MELLGAKVHAVTSGTMTLKDAVNETMREWSKRMDDTLYVLGSVMGPHPFPTIVRDFQKIIGEEIKEQLIEKEQILELMGLLTERQRDIVILYFYYGETQWGDCKGTWHYTATVSQTLVTALRRMRDSQKKDSPSGKKADF